MKKISRFILMFILTVTFFLIVPNTARAAEAVISNNGNGTVHLAFNNAYSVRVKLLVQLSGGKMYQYDVSKGNVNINVPLTQGNGTYKIILAKNISGTKYAVVQTAEVTSSVESGTVSYLTSNVIIDWNSTNKAIKKAYSLTRNKSGSKSKFSAIYKYIVKNYSYDYDKLSIIDSLSKNGSYIPDIDTTYSSRKGICYDISILMASMLRSVGIPTKVVTGYTPNATAYHAWNNVYLSGWKIVDATYDLQMYKAGRKYSAYKSRSLYKTIVYTY